MLPFQTNISYICKMRDFADLLINYNLKTFLPTIQIQLQQDHNAFFAFRHSSLPIYTRIRSRLFPTRPSRPALETDSILIKRRMTERTCTQLEARGRGDVCGSRAQKDDQHDIDRCNRHRKCFGCDRFSSKGRKPLQISPDNLQS